MKYLKKTDAVILFLVWIGFYLLNRLGFLTLDDLSYAFYYGPQGPEPITSVSMAAYSQWVDYFGHSGRYIVHFVTQCFAGFIGYKVFAVINTCVFTAFYGGLIVLFRRKYGETPCLHLLLVLLIGLISVPGLVLLGPIAYSTNYLWTLCGTVYFLLILSYAGNRIRNFKPLTEVALVFIALIIGALQESFSLPISGALFVYYVFHFKQFRGSISRIVAGYWVGTVFVSAAPGNFVRLLMPFAASGEIAETNIEAMPGLIVRLSRNLLPFFTTSALLWILICGTVMLILFKRKSFRQFVSGTAFEYATIGFCFLLGMIVQSGERQMTCMNLFCIIIVAKMIYKYLTPNVARYRVVLNIIMAVIILPLYLIVYAQRSELQKVYNDTFSRPSTNGVIVAPEYMRVILEQNSHPIARQYSCMAGFEGLYKSFYEDMSNIRTNNRDSLDVTCVLPEPADVLIERFNRLAVNGVMRNDEEKYAIIHSEVENPQIAIQTEPRSALARKVFDYMHPGELMTITVNDLSYPFEVDGKRYFIYYYVQNRKVIDIQVE